MDYLVKFLSKVVIGFFVIFFSHTVSAALTPIEVVTRAENLLWGKTINGDFDMKITTPSWTRVLSMRMWMDRPNKTFILVTQPAKDNGIASLRINSEMWNYLPSIERTIKIPPSMMAQPWLGSDFANDDLVKESSLVNDYNHRFVDEAALDGEVYKVEGLPKPNAAVVWGKIVYHIRKNGLVPLKLEYYDERDTLVRVLTYSEIRFIGGRNIPTRWEMQATNKPGKQTTITVKSVLYDKSIDEDIFSLRHLKQK